MADKKISQLTAATTPLAGTEVLPIVQSGSTVKVASDDLTVKNVRSNATTGILQVVGPAAASTRVMTTPDANFTVARTDAGQTFTGTQTFAAIGTAGNANLGNSANNVTAGGYTHRFSGKSISPDGSTWLSSYGAVVFNAGSDYTGSARRYLMTNALDQKKFAIIRSVDATTDPSLGNGGAVSSGTADFVITDAGNVEVATGNVKFGTAAKGIDFSANSGAPGKTSQLLDDYEEGTWTPEVYGTTADGTATYSVQKGNYVKAGNLVWAAGRVTFTSHTGTGDMRLRGLPFTATNTNTLEPAVTIFGSDIAMTAGNYMIGTQRFNATYIEVLQTPTGGGTLSAVPMDAAGTLFFTIVYQSA